MQFSFSCIDDNGAVISLTTPDILTWSASLYYYQQFLDGCGYFLPPGRLDIVEGDRIENLSKEARFDE